MILITLAGCTYEPPVESQKPMLLNIIESRFSVPEMEMCGSFLIYDTVYRNTTKPWYNISARDTKLPCAQYVIAHNKQGIVRPNNTMIYAHFLIYSDSIVSNKEGTSRNFYNEFKGDCSWSLDPTKPN